MSFTTHLPRHGLRLTIVALASVALFSACDTDRPLAPRPDAVPTSPQLAKGSGGGSKGGTIVITVVDLNGTTLTGGPLVFSGMKSGQAKFGVQDNEWGDDNPAVGVIQLSGIQNGQYSLCQTHVPIGYLLPNPACKDVGIGGGGPTQVTIVNAGVPRARWVVKDGLSGDSIGGALFTANEGGTGNVFIVDNMPLDLMKRPGGYEVAALSNGASVQICPALPPAGRVFGTPPKGCVTKTISQTTDFGTWYVYPEYSIYWWATVNGVDATDGEYTVTAVGGGFSTTITNNTAADMWKNTWIYMNVPGAGLYNVCQTVPPAGTKLAQPACRQVTGELGHPGFAQPFQNEPL